MEVSPDTAIILLRLDTLEEIQKDIMELLRGEGDNLGIVAQVKVNTGKLDNMEDAVSYVKEYTDGNVHSNKIVNEMLVKHDRILFGTDGNIKLGIIARLEMIERTFSTQGKIVIMFILGMASAIGGVIGTYIIDKVIKP